MNQLVEEFLKHHTLDDVDAFVSGELNEYSTDIASYCYGNGELIIWPDDINLDPIIYVIDKYGDKKYLVEY